MVTTVRVVNDDLTLCSNATYSGMSVASGVTVTICSSATVTFTGFIKNEGTIFVENGGGLIQTGGWEDSSGSGTWTAKRSFVATVEITTADSYRGRFYLHLHGSAMSSSDDEAIVEAVRGFVSEGAFVFEAPSAIESIVIMTSTGQVVQRVDGNGETYAEIGHENLAPGVYPAVVSLANGQSSTLKLMVP